MTVSIKFSPLIPYIVLLMQVLDSPLLCESFAAPFIEPSKSIFVEKPPLSLAPGEQRLLSTPGLEKYSLGSQAVRAFSKGDTLLVKGMRLGLSDLWVWKKGGSTEHRTIRVEASIPHPVESKLAKALEPLQETEILFMGPSRVILRGKIHTLGESARIAALSRAYPQEIQDETELTTELLTQGVEQIDLWLRKSGYSKHIRLEPHDQNLWVRGSLASPSERISVERKIRAIFPAAEIELDSLPDTAPTVHFRVYLLEVRKSRFGSFGLTWPANQAGVFQISSWGLKEALQLDLTLEALEGDGTAKVLSRPELVVRAPGEAELFTGGEIPVRTAQGRHQEQVAWKTFGLTLKLKVTQVSGSQVRLDVNTEVSHLDPTLTNDPLPGLQANRMKTQVDAQFGQPLFLSGLLQDGARQKARGLPALRNIPVLGSLFGSEDYLNERSELVAILVPSSQPPRAPMHLVNRSKASWENPDPEILKPNAESQAFDSALTERAKWSQRFLPHESGF